MERRAFVSPRKESSALKSIPRQGHAGRAAQAGDNPSPVISGYSESRLDAWRGSRPVTKGSEGGSRL